jgi:hypothetical protein
VLEVQEGNIDQVPFWVDFFFFRERIL